MTTEEWLILLCLQSTTNKKQLKVIFKQIKEVKTGIYIIDIVQVIKSLIENITRLLGLEVYAKASGGQGGDGTAVLKCYQCQHTGHQKSDYQVP